MRVRGDPSTPSSVYELRSSHILRAATASESPGTRKMPSALVPPRTRTPSARNGSTIGTFCFGCCTLVGEIRHRVARRTLMGGMPHPVDISDSDVRVYV